MNTKNLVKKAFCFGVALLALGGGHLFSKEAKEGASNDVAAVVNGVSIKHQTVLDLIGRLEKETGNKLDGGTQKKLQAFVLNQLVDDELVSQAAQKAKSEDSSEVLKKVEDFKKRVQELEKEQTRRWAREAFLQKEMDKELTPDAVAAAVKDKKDMAEVSFDYFAVTDKGKAESAVAALKKDPKNFSVIANKHGEGEAGSKVRVIPPQLVENLPPFLAPLKEALGKNSVKKGEVFPKPVQVGNSYVIFLIKDLKRPAHPELLKDFATQELKKNAMKKIVDNLRKTAKIEMK